MMRGKLRLIPEMSSSRPAWAPMNTNPSWIRIGNSTSSGADTHAPSPPAATSHAAAMRAAAPPSTATAIRTRSNRCALRATAPETANPTTPIAMYVTGSHAEP